MHSSNEGHFEDLFSPQEIQRKSEGPIRDEFPQPDVFEMSSDQ